MIELIVKNSLGEVIRKYVGNYKMAIYYQEKTVRLNENIRIDFKKIESDIDQGKLVVIGA